MRNKCLCLVFFCAVFVAALAGCSANAPVAENNLMPNLEKNDPMAGRMGSGINYADLQQTSSYQSNGSSFDDEFFNSLLKETPVIEQRE